MKKKDWLLLVIDVIILLGTWFLGGWFALSIGLVVIGFLSYVFFPFLIDDFDSDQEQQ